MLGQFNLGFEAMSTCKKATTEAISVPDRLSSLPPELKGNILCRLNVIEAVRTSTLSSTWKNAWADMPKISLRDGNFTRTKFVTLVGMVLSLHKGTVEQFDISGNKSYHDEFARWILMLSRKSPRSIIIELNQGPPSCLFFISDLKSLHLENCTISLPRVFHGFKSLTDLCLKYFSSTDMDIQNLISLCPILTDLILMSFKGIHSLNIQAPTLKYLVVDGVFKDINMDAPNLEWAFLSLRHKAKAYQSVSIAHDKECYVKQSLGSLSDIKTLLIGHFFLKYLSKGCILRKLPVAFSCLEYIFLQICFWDQRQVLTACSLFKNAPNLKELDISSVTFKSDRPITWDQDQASIQELNLQMQMDYLVTVSVNCFGGLECEVNFVGKLLSWAPALEELKIEWKGGKDCSMDHAKLLALPRVSPRAKVIVTF